MNTQGIGLGLVIADQIVSQFDGDIKFKSKLGVGSTFTFTFQLEELHDDVIQDPLPQNMNLVLQEPESVVEQMSSISVSVQETEVQNYETEN